MTFTPAHIELTRAAATPVATLAVASYRAGMGNRGDLRTRREGRSPVSFWSLKPGTRIQGCQVQLPEDRSGWQEQGRWRTG